jgi:hypothetical protein
MNLEAFARQRGDGRPTDKARGARDEHSAAHDGLTLLRGGMGGTTIASA